MSVTHLNSTKKRTFRGLTKDNSHIVQLSPWPILNAYWLGFLVLEFVYYLRGGSLIIGVVPALLIQNLFMASWWRDIIREGTYEGAHNGKVQRGLMIGTILFIVSEIMFFFSFFWSFFHSALSPAISLGSVWPPKGIEVLDTFSIPLLNTILLLSSGAFLTWAHHSLLAGNRDEFLKALLFVLTWAVAFTLCQGVEYVNAPFIISDSVYGSCFYMATGFHGFHVIVGTIFLVVCLVRACAHHFTREHHVGFESAAWYWHFVDVVWIFLFVSIYFWGGY